ncbi:MAG: tetratricopeptide repeat protein [Elusimicrobiales bacterium]|nr:tetratricopeptide repeat protein [Elusimicrobiales bacterium]
MQPANEDTQQLFAKLLQTRDVDGKKELCRAIAATDTESPFGLFCLAWLLADKNKENREHALALYAEALELNEAFWFARFERGNIYYELGRYADSAAEYEAALKHGGSAANLFFNAALAWEKAGDTGKALAYYSRTTELDREHDSAWFARGGIQAAKRNFESAALDFTAALRIKPDNFSYTLARGLAYSNLHRFDLALADFNRAIQLNPVEPAAYLYRGNIRLLAREYDNAGEDFAKVLKLDPKNAAAWEFLGIIYCTKKLFPQGLWCFKKSLALNPANERIAEMIKETRLEDYEPAEPALEL